MEFQFKLVKKTEDCYFYPSGYYLAHVKKGDKINIAAHFFIRKGKPFVTSISSESVIRTRLVVFPVSNDFAITKINRIKFKTLWIIWRKVD